MKKRDDKKRAKTPEEIRQDLIARGLVTPGPIRAKLAKNLTYKLASPLEPITVLGVLGHPEKKT